jgi:hypothetical protein
MRLAMDGLRRLRVRSLKKAVDLALVLVEPVPKSLSPMLVLDFEVLLWSSATASALSPSKFLWWSMYRGILQILLSPAFPQRASSNN